jgi:glutathione peroxidase
MVSRSLAGAIGATCIAAVTTAAAAHLAAAAGGQSAKGSSVNSLYDLKTTSLDGKPADLGAYRGKVALVVNVASKCGYTPQYEGLEALHKELAPKGVVVLGFPSNDFGGQEPGSAEQIAQFCRLTYGVTFPMFSKVVTRPGPDQSPVYAFLGKEGQLPEWNFGKYVVGKDGQVVGFFPSRVRPDAKELRDTIARALSAS